MKQTDQTLLEQMRITEFEIANRKVLLGFIDADANLLKNYKSLIESQIDSLVTKFYELQTSIPEIALVIGDADTLFRLRSAQRKYILDLFSGIYDLEYVNYRLRIGLVHKRIGVEPKLYLAAVYSLKELINKVIREAVPDLAEQQMTLTALEKLFLFDITLVFETYIRSLVSEIESSKDKSDRYASTLEDKVKERTQQLEEMSRTDALTGLLNLRALDESLPRILRAAQRRSEPVSVVYIDINDFKVINDTQGHHRGDAILKAVGTIIKQVSRLDDNCFRCGGDEFCMILPNCPAEFAKETYIKRLKDEIEKQLDNVTLGIGIVQTGPNEYADSESLIHQADAMMYADKKATKSNG